MRGVPVPKVGALVVVEDSAERVERRELLASFGSVFDKVPCEK